MKHFLIFIVSLLISLLIFIGFEYEINEFNTKVRNFIVHQEFSVRKFNSKGIPHSTSASQGQFISPYYVVHYGLRYSDSVVMNVKDNNKHLVWYKDETQKYWNVQPPLSLINEDNFMNTVEWVKGNVVELNGNIHLPYDFEWKYNNLKVGVLKPIWWSGLTDSLAMNLMLRAYIYFGDIEYKILADKFYSSLTASVYEGGSMDSDNKFIIEYASEEIGKGDFAYVLNGGYYAYLNIKSYELYNEIQDPLHPVLKQGLVDVLPLYFFENWSYYDRLNNLANIKYNNINFAILYELAKDDSYICAEIKCDRTYIPYTFVAIYNGTFQVMVLHLLCVFILFLVSFYLLIYGIVKVVRK
ncbi:D-glucuronyl C5-epimerase family protein [Rheinheimera sp. MMS21-TC3]|uniref:D-glucuronyl C5-epimerase family protein n=1 Tax=Rheinheimera sp. MMS21-TC3 TaxID=3072790 RepID=UPI0028C3BCF0|nr:D-glucuronyl C5-epimerase family protein [Rheinheimera sp. MMS21-TC3]WNO61699.1 D-glucuronyl C5-epimerase family protein [Rheinheimera sp. MMS21-TC3]